MTKIAVNRSSGVFHLTPQIVQRICQLQGKPCYFFSEVYTDPDNPESNDYEQVHMPQTVDNCPEWFYAYTIPNPNEVFGIMLTDKWNQLSEEEQASLIAKSRECHIDKSYNYYDYQYKNEDGAIPFHPRTDPFLIQAIEEIRHEDIEVIEIPDDVEWFIEQSEEGYETIHEKHRIW